MGRVWTTFYTTAIKNLTDAQYRTNDNADKANINAAVRIYRVYLMSLITDIHGDIPYSEAGKGFLEEKFNPRYDTQEEIYNDFFTELKTACNNLDASKDKITGDVIYNGDVNKWKKLANSLRLRFAMRISNVAPQKAQQEFEAALQDEGGIFQSSDDDALIQYMENHSVSDKKLTPTTVVTLCHSYYSVMTRQITRATSALPSSTSCIIPATHVHS